MATEHPLERQSKMLGEQLKTRTELFREMLGPRPLWTEQLSKPEALAWWRAHRYDEVGQKLVSQMDTQSILELDVALNRALEAQTVP